MEAKGSAFHFPQGFAPRSCFRGYFNVVHSRTRRPRHAILQIITRRTPCLHGLPLRPDRRRVMAASACASFRVCVSRACSFVRRLLSGNSAMRILRPRDLHSLVGTRVRGVRGLC